MNKKSILFLTNAYPDFETSYRGIFIKQMATLLRDEGYQINVVTPRIYHRSRLFEDQGRIKVYRFPFFSGNKPLIQYKTIPYFRLLLYFISGFLLTIFVALKSKCQLIHVHWAIPTGLIGVFVGALLKKPLLVTIHGSDLRMAIKNSGWIRKLYLYVCKKACNLTCVSEFQKREIEQMGLSGEKISVFPMGIERRFLEVGKDRKNHLKNQHSIVVSNRNLLPIYNVSLLIHAIPLVLKEEPEVRFLIAGEGPEKTYLEEETKNLGVCSLVKFLGRILHDDMPELLGQSDIYVSTSLYDGTSVSLLEAMATGAFPVVTNIPANQQWIKDGENGFLIPPDDESILATKIIEAIRNKELLARAREKNLKIVEQNACWENQIQKLKKRYERILV